MKLPGLSESSLDRPTETGSELVVIQRPLQRVLAFTGRSIDDVINCPFARREVMGFYKLHCWVKRSCEVSELERQWNSV